MSAPACVRGRSRPPASYARSANPSSATRSPRSRQTPRAGEPASPTSTNPLEIESTALPTAVAIALSPAASL